MQSSLFPLNSRSSFQTYIHLSYISNDDIEVAIKSITFDNEYEHYIHGEQTLALKMNLSFETISSYSWDKIISIFSINPKNKGICQIELKNPTFFSSNLHNLCRATFNIVNIETGNDPKFTTGSPTFIEVVVKSQAKRMKTPFHIRFLMWGISEKISKQYKHGVLHSITSENGVSERLDVVPEIYTLF